ncbi:hypothetical protein ACN08Y_10405 [Rothia sp. P5764]|uniref:hypothetical protein n=1 Tax=Rothia sp. P5764 TaxID=3402654 RepID=UPI003ACE3D28
MRIDERRRFEEAARERAEDLENRHMYAQNVLSHAHLARLQMESANPNTPPLGRAIADLLGGESQ